ncbi:hypothetical protein V6N12_042316 [Hibiscus sabdariffa]|uniref:Uncharacterized protein n=1 Tax=Hibiscus sabdariffa TaxID=183260 RepID=A0ABR2EEE5_9ROSI
MVLCVTLTAPSYTVSVGNETATTLAPSMTCATIVTVAGDGSVAALSLGESTRLSDPPGVVVSDHGMDGISTLVVIPPSLEQFGSPIPLDDNMEGNDMPLSDVGESDGSDAERDLFEEAGLAKTKAKATYASVVLGSTQDGGCTRWCFLWLFGHIEQFCGKNAPASVVQVESEEQKEKGFSPANLYGPWMLAGNKKRRPRKNFQSDIGSGATNWVDTVAHGAGDVAALENLGQHVVDSLPASSRGSRKKGLVKGSGGASVVALRQGALPAVTTRSMIVREELMRLLKRVLRFKKIGLLCTSSAVLSYWFYSVTIPNKLPHSGPSGGELSIDPGDHVGIHPGDTVMSSDKLNDGVMEVGNDCTHGDKENHVWIQGMKIDNGGKVGMISKLGMRRLMVLAQGSC